MNCVFILVCIEPSILNGTLLPNGNATVGDTKNITCEKGYIINGTSDDKVTSAVLQCMEDGTWNGTLDCELKSRYIRIRTLYTIYVLHTAYNMLLILYYFNDFAAQYMTKAYQTQIF